tara:strand:+ start:426 stop:1397 length:972 start_codon:yes stop_codon:yes gene_type:complete
MTEPMLRAGIIGAGQIAWRYDGGRWDGTRSVSHAACLDRHPQTRLVAIVDPDPATRADAGAALGPEVAVMADLDAFLALDLDLICIASPTAFHAAHVRAAARAGVRFLLVEKPVTNDMQEFSELVAELAAMPVRPRSFVNYFRRGLPQVYALRAACQRADLVALDFTYSRSLAINGVHMIDLCGYLLGLDAAPQLVWADPKGAENPSFALRHGDLLVQFRGMDLPFHCIECRATFADGRLSLLEGGLRLEREDALPNPAYPGFFRLGPAHPAMDPAEIEQAFLEGTYRSLCALLDTHTPSPSPLEGSAFAQQVLAAVQREVRP